MVPSVSFSIAASVGESRCPPQTCGPFVGVCRPRLRVVATDTAVVTIDDRHQVATAIVSAIDVGDVHRPALIAALDHRAAAGKPYPSRYSMSVAHGCVCY